MAIALEYTGDPSSLDAISLRINDIVMTNIGKNAANAYVSATSQVASLGYRYQLMGESGGSYTYTSDPNISLSGLESGKTYEIDIIPYEFSNGGGDYGRQITKIFATAKDATKSATVVQSANVELLDAITKGQLAKALEKEKSNLASSTNSSVDAPSTANAKLPVGSAAISSKPTNSVFQLSNPSKIAGQYVSAEKTFSKIATDKEYYAFGTTMFLKSSGENTINAGGINIFSDSLGSSGYFLEVQSSDTAYLTASNPIRILKNVGGNMYPIDDSQDLDIAKFGAVFGGEAYKINILVRKEASKVSFMVFINGFRITAVDVDTDASKTILSPTNKISLLCSKGTVYFDYVYGMNIVESDWNNSSVFNIYDGKFSDATLSLAFGDKVVNASTTPPREADIDEFGTVAREIKHYKIKYKNPSFPLYPTTGANSMARIIGKKMNSFNAEIFVINNSGTYVPLVDDESNSLWLLGKSVSKSGYSEYEDVSINKYNNPQPVTFESKWIQKGSDAKALAEWIKGTWSSKKQILNIYIFGNPLLSVGDIIKVHYPYNDMDGTANSTERYVITGISNSYNDGLSTTITCRTL